MTDSRTPFPPVPPRRMFRDRSEAGQALAELLSAYGGRDDVVVLRLARGGVPVAFEVARALRAPLDVCIVRKLGAPGQREFAIGAIARGGRIILHEDTVADLRITPEQLREITERETRELQRREAAYRLGRAPAAGAGKVVIVVDDGVATGASMRAALSALREDGPARIVLAVPAAPDSTERDFAGLVDEVVCAPRRPRFWLSDSRIGISPRSATSRCAPCWPPRPPAPRRRTRTAEPATAHRRRS